MNFDRPQPPLADANRGGAGLYFAADFERSARRFKLSKISGPDSQPLSAPRTVPYAVYRHSLAMRAPAAAKSFDLNRRFS